MLWLLLPYLQLLESLNDQDIESSELNIAIGHHPTSVLCNEEKNRFLDFLQSRKFSLYLCGHKHKPEFIYHSDYDGYEITWTCTNPKHRHKGLVINMQKECEKELPNDGIPIYCSCWRIKDNKDINMKNVMKSLGYNIITKDHKTRKLETNKSCNDCIFLQSKCYCADDLYCKKR